MQFGPKLLIGQILKIQWLSCRADWLWSLFWVSCVKLTLVSVIFRPPSSKTYQRRCRRERSEVIPPAADKIGLPRHFVPRNDGERSSLRAQRRNPIGDKQNWGATSLRSSQRWRKDRLCERSNQSQNLDRDPITRRIQSSACLGLCRIPKRQNFRFSFRAQT